MYSREFQEIVTFRRSNRKFDPNVEIPDDVIRRSLERAVLSPNSSNMQLWEFYWLRSEDMRKSFVPLCMDQQAAKTAKQMVVFVTRRDKWKERAAWNLNRIKSTIKGEPTSIQKKALKYYGVIMPLLYRQDPLGILNGVKRIIRFFIGLTRPFFRSGGSAQQRIMVHKSCALAAQTFMLSIAAEGFHSCPMEGFDEIRVKRALGLSRGAEINMIISVGKGTEAGIWGPRFRVPNEEVIFER
ncbi:MAG: nitroreductase family protein [Bacteroidetes bacterium]|nr:nitroreductase family protein [Bacteroidota bacterium]